MGRYIMELTLYHALKLWFADVHSFHDVFDRRVSAYVLFG